MIKKFSAEGFLLLVILIMGSLQNVVAQEFEHTLWDKLLTRHVVAVDGGSATAVDYLGMLKDRAQLQNYLDKLSTLSQQDFDRMNANSQLALLINAYNAATVDLILSIYPELESIRDLGGFFSSPWKKEFISLLGEKYSLDDIEHKMIRGSGRYHDPRIHFALNCASISCPPLRAQAYLGDQLFGGLKGKLRGHLRHIFVFQQVCDGYVFLLKSLLQDAFA